jgi:hypothetical protein
VGQRRGRVRAPGGIEQGPEGRSRALWQAAEFYEKGGARALAAKAYERYLKQYPSRWRPAVEARYRLAQIAKDDGNATREAALMREIFVRRPERRRARTDRTRYLGATAALAMAEPVAEAYRKVALVEPLKPRTSS